MTLAPQQIAEATGCPLAHVAEHWPNLLVALEEQALNTPAMQIAVAATVAVETGTFQPIRERRASQERQPGLYAQQERYWSSGYYGRGFIQLTWRGNYHDIGAILGVDLEGNPDLALDPVIAARVLAFYLKQHGIQAPAEAGDWARVRRLVNGGTNGLEQFLAICGRLA